MRYRIGAFALVGVLAACASGEPRRAGPQAPPGRPVMATPTISADVFLFLPYDRDHDHRLSLAERDAAISGAWLEMAGDRDQVRLIALQDWLARVGGMASGPFNPLEFAVAGGGVVSRDQFTKALEQRFTRLDKNGDGLVEPSEFMTVTRIDREGPGGGPPPAGMGRRKPGGSGPPPFLS